MMKPDSNTSPAQFLAIGFANHMVTWASERNASQDALDLLRRVAYAVSTATTEGHVCLLLNDIPPTHTMQDTTGMRSLLLASGVVGTPSTPETLPLIVDDDGRIYLHRYFDYERRLAQRLIQARAEMDVIDGKAAARLDNFFAPSEDSDRPDWQKIAAALALHRKLTIISGGPGTGKTTAVVNLLACLLDQNPDCRIALAAPTGKAAARMQEAIRLRAANLSPELQSRLPKESFTIHRLLGVMPPEGKFRHHAGNLLPIDALVVDEASMLDIALATQLLEAVPQHARIILLGDKDQLSAVEAGAVFSEISADPTLTPACIAKLSDLTGISAGRIIPPPALQPTALHDSIVWFTQNYRFASDSSIGKLATLINAGEAQASIDWLRAPKDTSVAWLDDAEHASPSVIMQYILDGYGDYLHALQNDIGDKLVIFRAFDRFRVLCAIRSGSRGVQEINQQVSSHFQQLLSDPTLTEARSDWYLGRPIIVQRNDYLLKLFNGDIGITLPEIQPDGSSMLMVFFPDKELGFRAIAPVRLPQHETAYTMTVHKSQGSEFDSIMLLLPNKHSRVISRELLYTAITRSRGLAVIAAGEAVLKQAIESPARRLSGLVRRMEEADTLHKDDTDSS